PRLTSVGNAAPVPGLRLGRILGQGPEGWRVEMGGEEVAAAVDASVDPALLADAAKSGARGVLESAHEGRWVLVGLLATQRAVAIDRHGDVDAQVRRFKVSAEGEVLFKQPGAFLQLKLGEAELYATRIACRARELTRLLGRMIKLN